MPNNGMDTLLEVLRTIMVEKSGARFRLRDILPVEISLVDRAANKRRFLTIKNKDGVNAMATLLKVDLPANIREGVEKALTAALQQLHVITKAVTEGAALSEDGAVVPEEFRKALDELTTQLGGVVASIAKESPSDLGTEASDKLKAIAAAIATIAEADSPDSVSDMIGRLIKLSSGESKEAATLKALGDLAIALSSDPTEGLIEKVQALTKVLSDLVDVPAPATDPATPPESTSAAKTDNPTEPTPPVADPVDTGTPTASSDPQPPATEPTTKTDNPASGDAPAVKPPAEEDSVAKALGLATVEIAKLGAKMSQGRLSRLRNALKAIADLVDELGPVAKTDEPAPPPAAPVEPPPVADPEPPPAPVVKTDQPVDVVKMVQDLNKKVSTLMEKPVAPASRRVEGNPGTGATSPVPEPHQTRKRRWIV